MEDAPAGHHLRHHFEPEEANKDDREGSEPLRERGGVQPNLLSADPSGHGGGRGGEQPEAHHGRVDHVGHRDREEHDRDVRARPAGQPLSHERGSGDRAALRDEGRGHGVRGELRREGDPHRQQPHQGADGVQGGAADGPPDGLFGDVLLERHAVHAHAESGERVLQPRPHVGVHLPVDPGLQRAGRGVPAGVHQELLAAELQAAQRLPARRGEERAEPAPHADPGPAGHREDRRALLRWAHL